MHLNNINLNNWENHVNVRVLIWFLQAWHRVRQGRHGENNFQPEADRRSLKKRRKKGRIICLLLWPTVLPLPFIILRQSCRLAGLFWPRWPVVNPAVQQQVIPRFEGRTQETGTRSVTMCDVKAEQWHRDVNRAVVGERRASLQPAHCVDSKSWWFTGVIHRLLTHECKPRGNQSCLQVGASDCSVKLLECGVSFMNHPSVLRMLGCCRCSSHTAELQSRWAKWEDSEESQEKKPLIQVHTKWQRIP